MRSLVRARHLQHVAKLREEQRVIGAFLPALAGSPASDKGVEVGTGALGMSVAAIMPYRTGKLKSARRDRDRRWGRLKIRKTPE
jgi:hypothetical protein